jgi:hypothetical protein
MRTWSTIAAIAAAGVVNVAVAGTEARASATPCVDVEVNGERAPSYPCLSEKLLPADGKKTAKPGGGLASESIVQRPSNQLGLFNHAATSHRMGNAFGTSVHPQRPAAPPPAAPVMPRAQP